MWPNDHDEHAATPLINSAIHRGRSNALQRHASLICSELATTFIVCVSACVPVDFAHVGLLTA